MDHAVAHDSPRYSCVLIGQRIWDMTCRFAYNRKISHDCFQLFTVGLKFVKGHVGDKLLNFCNHIENVKDSVPWRPS